MNEERSIVPGLEQATEAIAAAMWNIQEGYSVADTLTIGKGPLDWIAPTDRHPEDVAQRAMFLGHAAAVLAYLEVAGWSLVPSSDE